MEPDVTQTGSSLGLSRSPSSLFYSLLVIVVSLEMSTCINYLLAWSAWAD